MVFLVVTVAPLDTEEKIFTLYKERSGVAAEFPLVTFHNGGRTLAELVSFAAGGQVHIMHPDREVTPGIGDTPYKQPVFNSAIQTALDDDCESGETPILYELSVVGGSGSGEYEAHATITITADNAPAGKEFTHWSGDTDCLESVTSFSTKVTVPTRNISLTAHFRDIEIEPIVKKDNYMVISSWDAEVDQQGSSADIDSSGKADTLLTVTFNLKSSDAANEIWTWAKISGYANGSFEDVSSIELVYSSDKPLYLILDQEGLSETGESYRYLLPATPLTAKTVSQDSLKQPDWVSKANATALDLSKVQSLSFAATSEEQETTFELQGIYLDGYKEETPNREGSLMKRSTPLEVSAITNKALSLRGVEQGHYAISLYSLSGQKLFSTREHLTGDCSIPLESTRLTAGFYIVAINGVEKSVVQKVIMK